MSGLHVHTFTYVQGTAMAMLADDASGRAVNIEIRVDDHPALEARWEALEEAIAAAAQEVMLGLLDSAGTPPTVADVPPGDDHAA